MFRRNIYTVHVEGRYAMGIFIVAALNKETALTFVVDQCTNKERYSDLYIDSLTERDIYIVAKDAAVGFEGVLDEVTYRV